MYYREDLTWMKGMGCYVWDTPEIVRAKKSYELQSEVSRINKRSIAINDHMVHRLERHCYTYVVIYLMFPLSYLYLYS